MANIYTGSVGTGLRVREVDNIPDVFGVTDIIVTNGVLTNDGNGTITLDMSAGGGGVTTLSMGTTGLTPAAATAGVITIAGTLVVANGGTGLDVIPQGAIMTSTATDTLSATAGTADRELMAYETGTNLFEKKVLSTGSSGLAFGAVGGLTSITLTRNTAGVPPQYATGDNTAVLFQDWGGTGQDLSGSILTDLSGQLMPNTQLAGRITQSSNTTSTSGTPLLYNLAAGDVAPAGGTGLTLAFFAVQRNYNTGTITSVGTTVTGSSTAFDVEMVDGTISSGGQTRNITGFTSATSITINTAFVANPGYDPTVAEPFNINYGGPVSSIVPTPIPDNFNTGTGYNAGDVITIPQASIPGGTADLIITLVAADFAGTGAQGIYMGGYNSGGVIADMGKGGLVSPTGSITVTPVNGLSNRSEGQVQFEVTNPIVSSARVEYALAGAASITNIDVSDTAVTSNNTITYSLEAAAGIDSDVVDLISARVAGTSFSIAVGLTNTTGGSLNYFVNYTIS